MKQLIFPTDFYEMQHSVMPNSKQWRPKEETDTFISIVGGEKGLYGDGINTFEIMIDNDVDGWLSKEKINEKLAALATAPTPTPEGQKFTKGQWFTCIDHSREAGVYPKTYIECNGKAIAKCYDKRWTISSTEAEANALLISKAPAMYDALKKAQKLILDMKDKYCMKDGYLKDNALFDAETELEIESILSEIEKV